jgi:hypothetical protein
MTSARWTSVVAGAVVVALTTACGDQSAPHAVVTSISSASAPVTTPLVRVGAPARGPQQSAAQSRQAETLSLFPPSLLARDGHGGIWNNHTTGESRCHTTLLLPDGRQIEPSPYPTSEGTTIRLRGGALKYWCTTPQTGTTPPGRAFSMESALAAFSSGNGYFWRDGCGRARLAVTFTEVYTIPPPASIPPGGVIALPERTLNTCTTSPAKPTGWSRP